MRKERGKWKYVWEIGGVCALLFSVWMNIFPADRVIMGGDVVQFLNAAENFGDLWYEWLGRATVFLLPFFLLDKFGVSETAQLSWYLGIFLFGSYVSFWIFSRLVFPRAPKYLTMLCSLFYAANLYTLYIFTSTWGFTSYQSLYMFIPALTGLFLVSLQRYNWKYILGFLLAVFLASGSFSNPAFAVSLGMYFVLLTVGIFLFRFISPEKKTLYTIAILAAGTVALNAYWLFPSVLQIKAGISAVEASPDIVLSDALSATSNTIFDTLRMVQTFEADKFYPYNFPYPSFGWLREWVIAFSFVPIFLMLTGIFFKRKNEEKRIFAVLFFLLTVFIILVARARFPFETVNNFLFHLPVFNVLRGYDKMAIFTPFLISALLLWTFLSWQGKRCFFYAVALFSVAVIFLALPFFSGGIQTKLSYILENEKEKDYRIANWSALVKIPEEYREIEKIFRDDPSDIKISVLPYSPGSAIGRIKLPGLKINAPHFAHHLYRVSYIEPNDYLFDAWKPIEEFAAGNYHPKWAVNLYGLRGVKYIIYHKDAGDDAVYTMEGAQKYLQETGAIHVVTENENFILYEIDAECVFPLIYTSDSSLKVASGDRHLYEKIEAYKKKISAVEYNRKNLMEYSVRVNIGKTIVFNKKYDSLFRAEHIAPDGKRKELKRNEKILWANAWNLAGASGGNVRIYHRSLPLLHFGFWISAISLVIVFVSFVWLTAVRKK